MACRTGAAPRSLFIALLAVEVAAAHAGSRRDAVGVGGAMGLREG